MEKETYGTIAAIASVIIGGVFLVVQNFTTEQEVKLETPYHAVWLKNGSVYFGELEGLGTDSPILHHACYLQEKVNQQTQKRETVMVKRAKRELHNPNYMMLRPKNIVMVESVAPTSRIALWMDSLNSQ